MDMHSEKALKRAMYESFMQVIMKQLFGVCAGGCSSVTIERRNHLPEYDRIQSQNNHLSIAKCLCLCGGEFPARSETQPGRENRSGDGQGTGRETNPGKRERKKAERQNE